jgi:ubiquinone/menaquinone biosynthesis C-methylase UbiE
MLTRTKDRVKELNKIGEYSLQQASAYKLPFDDKTFDCLISCYMLDLLPEEYFGDILTEFQRVLKPGGSIILSSMTFGWKWPYQLWEWMSGTFPDLMTDCRPVNLAPFVKQAGFGIVGLRRISQHTFPSQIVKAMK